MSKLRTYWPSIVWIFVILVATLLPSSGFPKQPDWGFPADKLAHFLLFFVLSLLLIHNRSGSELPVTKFFFLFVVTFAIVYGLLLETAQNYIPGRDFSWLDLLADALGGTLGMLLYGAYVKYKGKLVLK